MNIYLDIFGLILSSCISERYIRGAGFVGVPFFSECRVEYELSWLPEWVSLLEVPLNAEMEGAGLAFLLLLRRCSIALGSCYGILKIVYLLLFFTSDEVPPMVSRQSASVSEQRDEH